MTSTPGNCRSPGDAVFFEKSEGTITHRRAERGRVDRAELESTISGMAGDMKKVGERAEMARENLLPSFTG